MLKKKFKIIYINILIILALLICLNFFLEILNKTIGGINTYEGTYFNIFKRQVIKYRIEQNRSNKYDNFYRVFDKEYKKNKYSGVIKKENCGISENGKYDLIFKTDKNGFRENLDSTWDNSDYVILGDSTVMSTCVNKPYDLMTLLRNMNSEKSFLNMGIHGSQPMSQLAYYYYFTKNKKINNIIWVFTEANDYEIASPTDQDLLIKDVIDNSISKKLPDLVEAYLNYGLETLNKNLTEEDYKVEQPTEKIKFLFKLKVYISKKITGLGSVAKYFKKYDNLLDQKNYEEIVKNLKLVLDRQDVNGRYIYYSPGFVPIAYKFSNNHPQAQQFLKLKSQVKKIAEANGFVFIDGYDAYKNKNIDTNKVFHYGLPTHFNEYGYYLKSKHLSESIIK
jgi:hypothetical protein